MNNNIYIVWKEEYNTGINIIDEQHRGIISAINTLHHFIQDGRGEDILKSTMIILEQYIDIHFKTEEALMEKSEYSEFKEHLELHKKWDENTKKLVMNKDTDSSEVLKFLRTWWIEHINKEDRKYIPSMKKLLNC